MEISPHHKAGHENIVRKKENKERKSFSSINFGVKVSSKTLFNRIGRNASVHNFRCNQNAYAKGIKNKSRS